MTVQQARFAKEQLRMDILDLVNKFEKETGFEVNSITLTKAKEEDNGFKAPILLSINAGIEL